MAIYKFTKTAKALLTQLVLYGPSAQIELPVIISYATRTVQREIANLKRAGYIKFAGLEPTTRRPRFLLRPTFFGVLEIFVSLDKDTEKLSKIAERCRNLWVIFEEWNYISANEDLRDLTLSAIEEWLNRNTLPDKGVGLVSLRDDILPQCQHRIMAEILWGGDPITRTTDGLIFKPETLAYFKKNPRLNTYMEESIERQAERYKMRLVIIEAWSKGKLMSTVLKEWSREWPQST